AIGHPALERPAHRRTRARLHRHEWERRYVAQHEPDWPEEPRRWVPVENDFGEGGSANDPTASQLFEGRESGAKRIGELGRVDVFVARHAFPGVDQELLSDQPASVGHPWIAITPLSVLDILTGMED